MVEKPKRTTSPLRGCRHGFSARAFSAARSSPLVGGAARSDPTIAKRRCAHRSCARPSSEISSAIACAPSAAPIGPSLGSAIDYVSTSSAINAHLLRAARVLRKPSPAESADEPRARPGHRREESQRRHQPIAFIVPEALDERGRQLRLGHRRNKSCASRLPKAHLRKDLSPPLAPSCQRLGRNAEQRAQPLGAPATNPVPH